MYLIIGSGAREAMLCKKLQDQEVHCIGTNYNPTIEKYTFKFTICSVITNDYVVDYCLEHAIDCVVIGPELYLQQGMVNDLMNICHVIGPTKEMAQIETSKLFCRQLLSEINPNMNPRYSTTYDESFSDFVVKKDGLAGGKGVKMDAKTKENVLTFVGSDKYLIEERLYGQEFSLMSFCDGVNISHMPLVTDFKRAYNNNTGPNTGGMGSYSCSNHLIPGITKDIILLAQSVNKQIMQALGYHGILYGSFMITSTGLKVIEYNARFGDPEIMNIMTILDIPLHDVFQAMIRQTLDQISISYKRENTICVYGVPMGYPDNSIKGTITVPEDVEVIYGAINEDYTTTKSRTLCVIGSNKTDVYNTLSKIGGPLYYRTDIDIPISYASAGVDIDTASLVITNIKKFLPSVGGFGGLYSYGNDYLVSSTDGVGTKTIIGIEYNQYLHLGEDIVNHCVNDVLVQGAKPLFFLDYLGFSQINPNMLTQIIHNMHKACNAVGCQLVGGELAQMPDVYKNNIVDVVGTMVGVVEKNGLIDGTQTIKENDLVFALRSNGFHTNGYTMIRKVLNSNEIKSNLDIIMRPHRCYLNEIMTIRQYVKGMAHITGGGLIDNPPRILPKGYDMLLDRKIVEDMCYPIMNNIRKKINMSDYEFYKTFNCGIGMLVVIDPHDWNDVKNILPESIMIGKIVKGKRGVLVL